MATRPQTIRILATLAVLAAVGGIAWLMRSNSSPTKVFCGPAGQLTSTAPQQSHRSYCLRVFTPVTELKPGAPLDFTFDLVDDRGETLRQFETVHEKIMHVIVVRHDLVHFQHVHPSFSAADGRFTVDDLLLPTDGPYRLFADFTPVDAVRGSDGQPMPVTVPVDVQAGDEGPYAPESLPQPSDFITVGEFDVTLSQPAALRAGEMAELTFTIRRGEAIVTDLEPYLGANGHAVVLREGDLAFIHSHAVEDPAALRAGTLPFTVHFGESGTYRMFVQFQHRGVVQTAAFTLPPVGPAIVAPSPPSSGHMGH